MNRLRMMEYAKTKMEFYEREIERCVEELPGLRGELRELNDFIDSFDDHRGVQGKIHFLLAEYGETPDSLTTRIAGYERRLEEARNEVKLWQECYDRLIVLWPDIKEKYEL